MNSDAMQQAMVIKQIVEQCLNDRERDNLCDKKNDCVGAPSLRISKTITTPGPYRVGQEISSVTHVCNNGTADAKGVDVKDSVFELDAPSFNLAPGECESFEAKVVITPEIMHGRMLSSASTATYLLDGSARSVEATHQLSVEPVDPPCVQLTYKKNTSNLSDPVAVNDVLGITTCIRNDGTTVAKVILASQPDNEIVIQPNQTDLLEATYQLTQEDVDRGYIAVTDTANAYGDGGKSSASANCEISLTGSQGTTGGTSGEDGLSAYEVAVENGFIGTEEQWLVTLEGADGAAGQSAYALAVDNGFTGTEADWLASLQGADGAEGQSAYEIAVQNGFPGTEQEWLDAFSADGFSESGSTDANGDVSDGAGGTVQAVDEAGNTIGPNARVVSHYDSDGNYSYSAEIGGRSLMMLLDSCDVALDLVGHEFGADGCSPVAPPQKLVDEGITRFRACSPSGDIWIYDGDWSLKTPVPESISIPIDASSFFLDDAQIGALFLSDPAAFVEQAVISKTIRNDDKTCWTYRYDIRALAQVSGMGPDNEWGVRLFTGDNHDAAGPVGTPDTQFDTTGDTNVNFNQKDLLYAFGTGTLNPGDEITIEFKIDARILSYQTDSNQRISINNLSGRVILDRGKCSGARDLIVEI